MINKILATLIVCTGVLLFNVAIVFLIAYLCGKFSISSETAIALQIVGPITLVLYLQLFLTASLHK